MSEDEQKSNTGALVSDRWLRQFVDSSAFHFLFMLAQFANEGSATIDEVEIDIPDRARREDELSDDTKRNITEALIPISRADALERAGIDLSALRGTLINEIIEGKNRKGAAQRACYDLEDPLSNRRANIKNHDYFTLMHVDVDTYYDRIRPERRKKTACKKAENKDYIYKINVAWAASHLMQIIDLWRGGDLGIRDTLKQETLFNPLTARQDSIDGRLYNMHPQPHKPKMPEYLSDKEIGKINDLTISTVTDTIKSFCEAFSHLGLTPEFAENVMRVKGDLLNDVSDINTLNQAIDIEATTAPKDEQTEIRQGVASRIIKDSEDPDKSGGRKTGR